MSKKSKSAAPPTVLVITLEADGNASLLTRRGELAHLSQFTYRGLQEIIAAIQSGATNLAELEKNPPVADADIASEAETPPEADPSEAVADESEAEDDTLQAAPEVVPSRAAAISNEPQAKLF